MTSKKDNSPSHCLEVKFLQPQVCSPSLTFYFTKPRRHSKNRKQGGKQDTVVDLVLDCPVILESEVTYFHTQRLTLLGPYLLQTAESQKSKNPKEFGTSPFFERITIKSKRRMVETLNPVQ